MKNLELINSQAITEVQHIANKSKTEVEGVEICGELGNTKYEFGENVNSMLVYWFDSERRGGEFQIHYFDRDEKEVISERLNEMGKKTSHVLIVEISTNTTKGKLFTV